MDKPGISTFADLLPYLGAPGAMMAVICWFWLKGYIVTIRELRQREEMLNKMISDRDRIITEKNEQLDNERIETDRWRTHAFDNMKLLGQSTELARTAVKKIPIAKGDDAEGKDDKPC
jgi:hypothetical protein